MSKMVCIKLTKCTLVLSERELLQALPRYLFLKGLRKGKAFDRRRHQAKREVEAAAAVDIARANLLGFRPEVDCG